MALCSDFDQKIYQAENCDQNEYPAYYIKYIANTYRDKSDTYIPECLEWPENIFVVKANYGWIIR
jgi:hypothetical protein